ncbi:MAG TPA: ornithine cyclodeaminase [Gammaproteobacteria bacterium]|jgi:alanine dehydrogenase|nr:ornithine cyclodeaminase [Gammaproteobacteria bacterium]|tara:strand:+ start:2220 stop:3173 length:954 start_codon:yes stop_codon:yes gene_type:complete
MNSKSFHLDAQQIFEQISFGPLVDDLARMHRESPADLQDMLLEQPGQMDKDYCLIRAAWQGGAALGVKIASVFPANVSHDLPAIHAAYILFDGINGVPVRSIDGNALTYLKTAADSALGSQLLARPDCRRLLMVGAGAMAPYLIEAHCTVHPQIEEIRIWNRSVGRRDALLDEINNGRHAEAAEDLAEAVAWADLVCCATMASEPLIQGQWLRPGTHLDLVGAFRKDMREADDEALRRAQVFVDSRKTTIGEIGELVIPMEAGVISEEDVLGDLYDLCANKTGRQNPKDITLFKNGGGGHLDLMTARHIENRCTPDQ